MPVPAIRANTEFDVASGVYIGREITVRENGRFSDGGPCHYEGGLHQLLMGPTGSGKGMRLQAPNLLSVFGKSMVVIDPKGQLATMTALYRHQRGDEVHIVDPFGVVRDLVGQFPKRYAPLQRAGLLETSGFNPLASLASVRPDLLYDEVRSIAQATIPTADADNPFWPLAARALFTGLVIQEVIENREKANLLNVYDKLTTPDRNITLPTGKNYRSTFADFVQLILNEEADLDREKLVDNDRDYSEALASVRRLLGRYGDSKANETLDSIRATAEAWTEWLNSGPISKDLSKDNLDLRRLKNGDRPLAIYIVLPSNRLEDHKIWLRLIVDAVIRACTAPGRGRDTLMMLDEFTALGYMEVIERQWGVVRDYGLAFWAAFQNYGQLTDTYPKYETMLSSTGIFQSFHTADPTGTEEVSKLAGTKTKVKLGFNIGQNQSDGGRSGTNKGLSREQISLPWLPPDELRGLPPNLTMAAFGGFKRVALLHTPHLFVDEREGPSRRGAHVMQPLRERALDNPYRADEV